MNGRDPVEARKSELRRMLDHKHSGIRYTDDGNLIFKPLNHWRKDPKNYKMPREAHIDLVSMKKDDGGLVPFANDLVLLAPTQYEYLLDVLRGRIRHLDAQPGANTRIKLLEERMFAVDLLCALDI